MYSITRHVANDAVLHDQISASGEQNSVGAGSSTVNNQTGQCDGVEWAGVDCNAIAAGDRHNTSFDAVGAGNGDRFVDGDRAESGAVDCRDLAPSIHGIDRLLK